MTKFEHSERNFLFEQETKLTKETKQIRVVVINERLPSESNERQKNLESSFTCFLSEFEKDICLVNKQVMTCRWRSLEKSSSPVDIWQTRGKTRKHTILRNFVLGDFNAESKPSQPKKTASRLHNTIREIPLEITYYQSCVSTPQKPYFAASFSAT